MNWDDVRFFLAAADRGSLAATGRSLGVDHTTVRRRISALEAFIGAELFERTRTGLRLTPAGEALEQRARSARRAFEDIERCANTIGEAAEALTGRIKVATAPTLSVSVVAPELPDLAARHPELVIELVAGQSLVSLPRRDADVALRSRPSGKPVGADSVLIRRVGEMEFGLYGSARYLDEYAGELEDAAMIGYAHGPGQPASSWLEANPGPREGTYFGNSIPTVEALCRAGLGLAVLPALLAEAGPEPLICVTPRIDVHHLFVAVHPDLRRTRRVQRVAEWLAEVVRRNHRRLAPNAGA